MVLNGPLAASLSDDDARPATTEQGSARQRTIQPEPNHSTCEPHGTQTRGPILETCEPLPRNTSMHSLTLCDADTLPRLPRIHGHLTSIFRSVLALGTTTSVTKSSPSRSDLTHTRKHSVLYVRTTGDPCISIPQAKRFTVRGTVGDSMPRQACVSTERQI